MTQAEDVKKVVEALRAPSFKQDSEWHVPPFNYATKPRALLDQAADLLLSLVGEGKQGLTSSNASRAAMGPVAHPAGEAEPSAALTVETAAVRIGEAVFTLPRPNRHHNILWWLHVLGVPSRLTHDQGFVLSDGSYAARGHAYSVAEAAGQIAAPGAPHSAGRLFSEDLWDGGADMVMPETLKALAAGVFPSAPLPLGEG